VAIRSRCIHSEAIHAPTTTSLTNWPSLSPRGFGGQNQLDSTAAATESPRDIRSNWYAFDQGNARFYILDATWCGVTNVVTESQYQARL